MKSLFLFCFVTFTSFIVSAQQFSIGITAGTGKAWTKNPPAGSRGPLETVKKNTNNYGVQLLMRASEHIYFGSHILFSKEGFIFGEPGKPNYVNFGMEYVRVTLQPIYYPLKSTGVFQPKVSAGLSGAYLLDGQSDFTDNNGNELGFKTKEIIESRFDFGYRFEAGVDIKLNKSVRLTTGAAYYNGTMRIADFYRKWNNKNITYNAGVLFRTSRK